MFLGSLTRYISPCWHCRDSSGQLEKVGSLFWSFNTVSSSRAGVKISKLNESVPVERVDAETLPRLIVYLLDMHWKLPFRLDSKEQDLCENPVVPCLSTLWSIILRFVLRFTLYSCI